MEEVMMKEELRTERRCSDCWVLDVDLDVWVFIDFACW
jgi:hypothetical protein